MADVLAYCAGVPVNAAAEADGRYFEPGTALHRVLQEAPYLPRCSDDKTAKRTRPREYAIRYPYMQVNRPGFTSWLIFDLDHAHAMVWQDRGLPPPNMIVRDRQTGHSHLYYAIAPVCTTDAARAKPIAYMKAIYSAYQVLLGADLDYHSGPVSKTPGHPWWLTHELHNRVYDLGDLAEYVDLAPANPWGKRPELDEKKRNSRACQLFDGLRYYAYSIVNRERKTGNYDTFVRWLENHASGLNNFATKGFPSDLPMSAVRSTVRSVARWTWEKYAGDVRCHRGAMKLDPDLPLPERQSLAALRTHAVRQDNTADKIRSACRMLIKRGASLTQVAIGHLAGVTRQTVAKYRTIVEAARAPSAPATLAAKGVKHAVHQVPAGAGALVARSINVGLASSRRSLFVRLGGCLKHLEICSLRLYPVFDG